MKINIDGRDYFFKFYHKNDGDTQGKQPVQPVTKLSKKVPVAPAPVERATICVIFNEAGDAISSGTTNVHPKDNFCKEKGRKIALSRAIKSWDKAYREQVWNEYRTWGAKDRW